MSYRRISGFSPEINSEKRDGAVFPGTDEKPIDSLNVMLRTAKYLERRTKT